MVTFLLMVSSRSQPVWALTEPIVGTIHGAIRPNRVAPFFFRMFAILILQEHFHRQVIP